MISRRRLLTHAAAALSLPMPFIQPAKAADAITVMSPFGFTPEFSDLFNAYSGGHYARQGLDATVLATRGAQSIQQLVAGRVQFIRNTFVDLVRAVTTQNLPLVAIGTLTQGSAFVVISAAAKPVDTVQDLAGKVVGIQGQVGGASSTYLELMLKHYGVPAGSVTMQVAGNSPGSFELVKQGRVDCFVGGPDTLQALQRMQVPVVGWSTDKYIRIPSQVYFTTRALVDSNPDLVTRFMTAQRASVNEMLTRPLPEIFEREAKDFEMTGLKDMAQAVASEQTFFPLWLAQGRDNLLRNVPDLWASGVALMQEDGLAGPEAADRYYTNRFVDASA